MSLLDRFGRPLDRDAIDQVVKERAAQMLGDILGTDYTTRVPALHYPDGVLPAYRYGTGPTPVTQASGALCYTYEDRGVIRIVRDANQPRIESDRNGVARGVLIEPARTNIWQYGAGPIIAGQVQNLTYSTTEYRELVAGMLTPKLREVAVSGAHRVRAQALPAGTTAPGDYWLSYALVSPADGKNIFGFTFENFSAAAPLTGTARFDLSTGLVLTTSGANVAAYIRRLADTPDGAPLYFCAASFLVTTANTATAYCFAEMREVEGTSSYLGTDGAGYYIAACGLEKARYPGSIILVPGSVSVTRAADVLDFGVASGMGSANTLVWQESTLSSAAVGASSAYGAVKRWSTGTAATANPFTAGLLAAATEPKNLVLRKFAAVLSDGQVASTVLQ